MHTTITSLSPQQVFLIQGNSSLCEQLVNELATAHISYEVQYLSRCTIEDAKEVVRWNNEHAGTPDWLIIYTTLFISEAAQVLLKTLEEPGREVRIVFVTPHPYLVPQTIRSRVRLLLGTQLQESGVVPEYMQSKKVFLDYIKDVLGDEDIDASERRAQATILLDTLEHLCKKFPEKVDYIYKAKTMLYRANMPTKQVMEYVATMTF